MNLRPPHWFFWCGGFLLFYSFAPFFFPDSAAFLRGLAGLFFEMKTMSVYALFAKTHSRERFFRFYDLSGFKTSCGCVFQEKVRCCQTHEVSTAPGLFLKKCLRTFWNRSNSYTKILFRLLRQLANRSTRPYHSEKTNRSRRESTERRWKKNGVKTYSSQGGQIVVE